MCVAAAATAALSSLMSQQTSLFLKKIAEQHSH